MEIGDLVKHWNLGMGFVISITEPTIRNPYQLATVLFPTGETEEFVTTSLVVLSKKDVDI
jgi:hypothetical protein